MPLQLYNGFHTMSTNTIEIVNFKTFQNNSKMSISYNSNSWEEKSININGYYYEHCNLNNNYRNHHHTTEKQLYNYCHKVFEYLFKDSDCLSYNTFYDSTRGQTVVMKEDCTIFTFYWTPDKNQTCLTMTYYIYQRIDDEKFVITLNMYDKNNMVISSTKLKKYNGISTLKITNIDFKNNERYKFSLHIDFWKFIHSSSDDRYNFRFGFIRIAQCSNYDEEDVRIITVDSSFSKNPISFNILENGVVKRSDEFLNPCLNGGYFTKLSKCVCPPGFKGQFCETGCGLNSYGSDCKGVCSMRADKMCRGMLMCTSYGCTCPTGLTGPQCNEDCTLGTYGADCKQTCSSNCLDNTCDQYTGVCLHGCSAGYLLPYCREKYPYFINPPTLLSATYDRIEIELNFQENNIKYLDKIMNLKYYQLFYKSLIEDTLRSFEIKPISNTNNTTTEIISDLESDTFYKVGVLLIAGDGNFNDQDVVYGQYKTTCIQPQITDYNIKLISGIQSINITWNIINLSRLECKITKYVLTLTSSRSQNQITDVQEILSSTESGHFLDNLLPGFQYNIKLTPSTINGTLPSSPMYSFTTLMSKNDVQIKNISTKHENGKIKISWILVNSRQHYTTVYEPVTSIIRYKLKRILSCSTREIEQNWTSITIYNQTNYEIFNTVPNSQYSIQVLVDVNDKNTTQENMIDVLTPASSPKTEPFLDPEHPIYITNNSIFVQWKVDSKNCSKLNGLLSQFYIELKDTVDDILQVRETKNTYISFNDLKSNTTYELKVFIKTHISYNPEHFLLVNFTTKFENLKSIEDLVVYKKSLKNRMVGFRWSYSQDTNLNGFIVSFNESNFIIPPQTCSAWPEYYCHTFYNLSPSSSYTFKIKPKSIDYPEGGKVSSIYFNSVDGLPDSPMNIKTTEIGNTSISIQWDIPWIFNGELKMFIINVEEIASVDMETCCISIAPTEILVYEELPTYNHTITGLQPGSTYSIGVLTVSKSSWYSSPSRLPVTTIEEM
ncbi:tenascin-like isoform X2 [Rhopalosiphum padi]|nr:tenascin-like isoform X2 [Rhopalosiphum padi]